MEWRRQIPVPRRAGAVGLNGPFDLAVNPISHIILHLDGVVAGAAAVGTTQPWTDLDNVTISFQGASIFNLPGEDLFGLVNAVLGYCPSVLNQASATNGDLVRLSIPIPFGRMKFNPKECFPATRKGDLQASLTLSAEGATFQTRNFSFEVVELPEAQPARFLKAVSLSRALTATDFDFPLPVGNPYAGLLIREPVVADAGIATGTVRQYRLLVDHTEMYVAASRFESGRDELESVTSGLRTVDLVLLGLAAQFNYLNFSPKGVDDFLLETDGRADVRLRFELDNNGTPVCTPIELVTVPGGGGA